VNPGPYNPAHKRQKEILRQKRQQGKAERRRQRQQERQERPSGDADEDPDLVGIVPGPQPKPEDTSVGNVTRIEVEGVQGNPCEAVHQEVALEPSGQGPRRE
jgi:hypothetical protein